MIVGIMMWCGDPECNCWVPVILDEGREVWRGEFVEHPPEWRMKELRESLRQECEARGAEILADGKFDAGSGVSDLSGDGSGN